MIRSKLLNTLVEKLEYSEFKTQYDQGYEDSSTLNDNRLRGYWLGSRSKSADVYDPKIAYSSFTKGENLGLDRVLKGIVDRLGLKAKDIERKSDRSITYSFEVTSNSIYTTSLSSGKEWKKLRDNEYIGVAEHNFGLTINIDKYLLTITYR